MRKLLIVILSVVASMCLLVGFAGCSGGDKGHVHTYSKEWTFDDTYHWHKATCEHTDEIFDKDTHKYVGTKCKYCGYDASNRSDVCLNIDVNKLLKAFADNAYTVNVDVDEVSIQLAVSLNDLYAKAIIGDDNKVFVDATGVYVAEDDLMHYASFKALAQYLFYDITDYTVGDIIEMISEYLPEDYTVDDLIAIFYNGETFDFDSEKATALIEAFFNDGITLAQVREMAEDGFTYQEVVDILKPEIIGLINDELPEEWTLENVMPFVANITPARVQALYEAFCAGELDADVINALLPDKMDIDYIISTYFSEAGITAEQAIGTINDAVQYINSINFDAISEDIEEIDVEEIINTTVNTVLDTLFVKEIVDGKVRYSLNYGLIKEVNQYLNDTTLEAIINSVLGDGVVDTVAGLGTYLLDTKLSVVKVFAENAIGIEIETVLDYIDTYADTFAPFINKIFSEMMGSYDEDYSGEKMPEEIAPFDEFDVELTEDESESDVFDILPMIKQTTAMIRTYLADADFMDKTVGEAIVYFSGETLTVEAMKEYINMAVAFLKENTVYDVATMFFGINKEGIYETVNNAADMLAARLPVYFVMNNAGELEELSVEMVGQFSFSVKKGDFVGEVFTEAEKAELSAVATKYTIADFKGYIYPNYYEYGDSSYTTHRVDITVKVELTENEGTYVISREYNKEYDIDRYEIEKHSYYFADADLSNALITVNDDGTVEYEVICFDYEQFDKNGEIGGYEGRNTTIIIVFGEDNTWLMDDWAFVDYFVPDAEELEAA